MFKKSLLTDVVKKSDKFKKEKGDFNVFTAYLPFLVRRILRKLEFLKKAIFA
jgi:hypothetical protein